MAARINRIAIKCSNDELDTLVARAKTMGIPLRTYIRTRALMPIGRLKQQADRRDEISQFDRQLYLKLLELNAELKRQGNNLNQLARIANQQGIDSSFLPQLEKIQSINQTICATLNKLSSENQ